MALAALAVGLLAWFSGVVPGVPGGLVRVEPDEAATLVPGERALSELATPEALTTRAAADERSAAAGEAIRERDRTVDGASAGLQPLITGRVLDAKGAPCAGARVIAATGWDQFVPIELGDLGQVSSSIQRALVETDVDGRFEVLDSLSLRGELVLHVSAPGHAPLRLERLPPRARGASSPADYGDLRLRAGSVVGGRVIDPSGAAVPGARLRLAVVRGEQGFAVDLEARGVPLAVAADDGSFGIEQLEGGPFTLLVDAPGRCAARVTGVASARPLDGLTVVLEAGSSIAGKVTGLEVRARAGETPKPLRVEARPGKPGEPVEGQGRAVGGARLAALAGDGSFQLDGLVDGLPYTLIVSEDRGERAGWVRAREVAPTEGTPGTRDLELAWDPQRCATFRVVDDRTGAPIEAFVAQWRTCPPPDPGRGDGLQLVTDGDPQNRPRTRFEGGVVTLDSLPSGEVEAELTVKITAVGYETKVVDTFVVRGGFETNLGEVRLTAAPTVRVAVRVKGTGTPVPGAGVYLAKRGVKALDWYVTSGRGEFGDDSVKYGVTGDDGVAVVTSLPGQRITIMVVSDRYATAEVKEHLLRPEGGDELVVEVSEGGTLVVRVCRPNGTPAEGVKVLRRRFDPGPNGDNNAHSEVVTDAEGLVRFARLPAGMHEATVWPRPVANGVAKAWVPC